MSVGGAKSINITFKVDEASANRAKQFISDLTRQVNQLADAANRAARAMAGVSGRPGLQFDKRSAGGPGQSTTHRTLAGIGPGGVAGMLTSVVGGGTNELRSVAQATQQAFNTVSSNLGTFVNKATSDVTRLQATVEKLTRSMSGLGRAGTGGNTQLGLADTMMSGGAARPAMSKTIAVSRDQILSSENMPTPFFGQGGYRGYIGQRFEGMARGMGLPAGAAERVGGFAGRFAGAAGIGLAAVGAYEMGAQAFESERAAQINYTLNEPLQRMQRRAAVAAPFRGQFGAVQSGDVASQVAFRRALNDPSFSRSLDNVTLQREHVEAAFNRLTLRGMAGNAASAIKGFAGRTYGDIMGALSSHVPGGPMAGLTEADRRSAMEIMREQALRNIGPEQAQKLEAAHQAELAVMNPRTAMLANQVYSGAMGRVQTMRMAGMSTGFVQGPRGPMSRMEAMESNLMRGGWSVQDYAQGHQQLLGLGAGYARALGPIGLISAQIGGMHNAGELVRGGGQMGGSVQAASDFYRMAQRSLGRGGLDVAAGTALFGGLQSAMLGSGQFNQRAGTFGGAGQIYAGAAAGLVGGGMGAPLDVAEQQQRLSMLMSGNNAFGRFTGGQMAPLYQATSLMGGIKATGGYSARTEALTKMNPMLLTGIARGGTIPEWARGLGVTQDMAGKFLKDQARAPLFEVTDDLVTGPARGLLQSVRGAEAGGGSFMDVIRSRTKGMRGAAKGREAQRISEQLGGVLYSQGLAASPEEGAGVFFSQLAQDKEFAPTLKGKGVGAAGPRGLEAEALNDQSKRMARAAESIATDVAKLVKKEGAFNGSDTEEAAVGAVASASGGQGGSMEYAAADLIGAIQRFASVYKTRVGASAPVKAMTKK